MVGAAHPIISIFVAKSVYGYRESLEIVTPQNRPLGEEIDPEELRKRIEADIVIDDADWTEPDNRSN